MPRPKRTSEPVLPPLQPATTPEEREKQLINLAENESERLMREHRAPASLLIHYLKLGCTREQVELEKIRQETELTKAKVKTTETAEQLQSMTRSAMDAFRAYSGNMNGDDADASDGFRD